MCVSGPPQPSAPAGARKFRIVDDSSGPGLAQADDAQIATYSQMFEEEEGGDGSYDALSVPHPPTHIY